MNFRFTKLKVIITLVLSVVIGFIVAIQTTGFDGRFKLGPYLGTNFVLFFIVVLLITYFVWSLLEKEQ